MPNYLIRRMAILGGFAILAILFVQGYWLRQTYLLRDSDFHRTVTIALYDVAERLAEFNQSELPKQNLIQRQSSNIYAVNINDVIDPNILEDYLIRTFTERSIQTDFEYAVYDCLNKELVYGNYCKLTDRSNTRPSQDIIPQFEDLLYYFVIRFPSRDSWIIGEMWQNILLGIGTLLLISFFIYSMWLILQQKKMSELQKDFINNMTHEFKTPISSIKIASKILQDSPEIKQSARLIRYAEIISDQNDRLNLQVEKVLNLAKLESDNFKLKKESIDLNNFVEEIVNGFQVQLSEIRRGYITLSNPTELIRISTDKLHLTNVINSLLDNAIKYCNQNPQILVTIKDMGDNILLSIQDNGVGLEKENISKIFTKFYRVPTGNVHDVKGFGLGLFYVKNIIDSHGWSIQVDSEPGVGSNFKITIPRDEQ